MKLTDRTIILTGASRGFGRYLAHILWDEGANLLLVARDMTALNSLRDVFMAVRSQQHVVVLEADLRYPRAATARVMERAELFGDVHGVVNNAAIQGPIGPASENLWKDYEETITVNLLSPICLSRAMAGLMAGTGGGKIVNMSGGGAAGSRPNFSAYATAKTGLVRFSECLAEEVRDKHIDVNCVAPGAMLTDMTRGQNLDITQEQSDATMAQAAQLVVFLLSSESDGVTGRLISAKWDDFASPYFAEYLIRNPELYTLKRKDRI